MTAQEFVNTWGITAHSEQVDKNPANPKWQYANHYKVTLKMRTGGKIRQFSTPFSKGTALKGRPGAAEVVECLSRDIQSLHDYSNYEDWAADFGYDPDSRKGEKAYKFIQDQSRRMAVFLYHANMWRQFLNIEDE